MVEGSTLAESIVNHEQLSTADLLSTLLLYFTALTVSESNDEKNYAHYSLCKPALLRLYAEDAVGFLRVAKKIKERLGIATGDIRRDMELLSVAREQATGQQARGGSQATRLVALTGDAELWHTPEGDAYATLVVNSHKEHWPLAGKNFRRWLRRKYYEQSGSAPGSQAVQDALGVLEGKAQFEGPEHPVFVRIAEHEGVIYIDLTDNSWRAAKITMTGWDVIADPPVKFRRPRGMQALPHPEKGGDVKKLRDFLNIADDQAWTLLLAWLVMALCPKGPFPILILHGEQGTAKSTLARILKALIDPNDAPLRAEPGDKRDLMVAATNSWLLAYDNLSHLPVWLSDSFCRLATGAGFGVRELYTNQEETILTAQRPIIINGIEEVATRSDVLDRAVNELCPFISPWKRKVEKKLWAEFNQESPRILGALFTAVSTALQNVSTVELKEVPRMADFVTWVVAAAPALGFTAQEFLDAYKENCQGAHKVSLEDSLIAAPLCTLAEKGKWEGTATQLLDRLTQDNPETAKKKEWPQKAQALSNHLRRIAPNLRGVGVSVEFKKESDKSRTRKILIQQFEQPEEQSQEQPQKYSPEQPEEHPGNSSSEASAASKTQQNQGNGRTLSDDPPSRSDDARNGEASAGDTEDPLDLGDNRTMSDDVSDDASDDARNGEASEVNASHSANLDSGWTLSDASDAKIPTHSNGSRKIMSDDLAVSDSQGFNRGTTEKASEGSEEVF